MSGKIREVSSEQVRERLCRQDEIALLDVREEEVFAKAHPLWAANLPASRIALQAGRRVPRRDTLIVVYGDDSALAQAAMEVFGSLGYTDVRQLAGGLDGWVASGGELFQDVNVPSKAFGELVESVKHTPSLSAVEVQALIDSEQDVVVVDARRYDEFKTMSIPTATSVPGGELVLRIREVAPDPATKIVVNCAGRTRSIIGAQSLINASVPNPVAALRNGTIGWALAGLRLDRGASAQAPGYVGPDVVVRAQKGARTIATRAGVRFAPFDTLQALRLPGRTTYLFDVRSPEEFEAGHIPGFRNAPGGQLVQETDHHAPVRGARVVLVDDDGVRATMTGSWLAQMGWDVWVLEGVASPLFTDSGPVIEELAYQIDESTLPPLRRYRRPYEGADNAQEAMQAYLEWEYGLVAQLDKDGTHNFHVV